MDGNWRSSAATEWLRLVQTVSLCGRQLRRLLGELAAPRGLTDTECLILWSCCEAPPEGLGQHELVSIAGVSPAQLSGLVEQLGSKGLLSGRRPAHDRRRQYWRLTPEGQTLVAELLMEVSVWLTQLPTAEDLRPLADRLAKLIADLSPATLPRGKEAA